MSLEGFDFCCLFVVLGLHYCLEHVLQRRCPSLCELEANSLLLQLNGLTPATPWQVSTYYMSKGKLPYLLLRFLPGGCQGLSQTVHFHLRCQRLLLCNSLSVR